MSVRSDIEFRGEGGVMLRGWLFTPDALGIRPAISMCHGFAAVKEHGLEPFARSFAQAGFVVLVHDHRNVGTSEGAPRQDIEPLKQIAGWHRALDYLVSRPEVDAGRIGIWGSSYSGGHALGFGGDRSRCEMYGVSSAHHQRLGTGEAQGTPRGLAGFPRSSREGFAQPGTCGAAPQVQAISNANLDTPAAYRSPASITFYTQDLGGAVWTNTVTLRSTHAARSYDPGVYISEIAPTPLMMVVASEDEITMADLELDAYARANEPKRLVMIAGGHFSPYHEQFTAASGAATEWLQQNLGDERAPNRT
ncbi:alpha/beta hydrolase [Pseudomonas ogarae]|uniref:alpha/beta hydrolase n=1 Tax=Pseudomonas ogarae (strain DSM 112162 / CECT 30235 / F113) TaxID=1114970 RepID=UPI001F15A128|nr:alpha/beta hydrolase [Pseudomonas ogarae]